jgi:citrate lyase beta subunit
MPNEIVASAERERERVLADIDRFTVELPLKFWRQQAHYTTPASNYRLAEGAASRGFAPTSRVLNKYGIKVVDLAETFGVSVTAVEELLESDPHSPVVMIDGEDAQALDEDVVAQGRANAVKIFREAQWGPTLRFYRPSGLRLPYCVGDLTTVLLDAGTGCDPETYPIDGIIFPKVEQVAEIRWVSDLLGAIERELGLAHGRIKLQILVESGWAAANLPALAGAAIPRLVGIIFGIADYAADLALPDIRYDHPVCDWARAEVVNMAGAVGVPAIDAMTVNYPVADPDLSAQDNYQRILQRLKECYDDTRRNCSRRCSPTGSTFLPAPSAVRLKKSGRTAGRQPKRLGRRLSAA